MLVWKRFRVELMLVLLLGLGGVATHRVNVALEGFVREEVETGHVGPLPNGRVLRVMSLGFERLIADLYWIRAVFYIGGEAAQDTNYPSAEPLAHLITDIDPYFDSAYVLLSSVIGGLRGDASAAIRLLEKGTQYNDYWRLYFMAGYFHFIELGDFAEGARYLTEAAKRGGPEYLPLLAARLYAQDGELDTAIDFIQARIRQEQHPELREPLERRLRDLVIQRDLGVIDAAIQRYAAEQGAAPERMSQLVEKGYLRPDPVDPSGQPYEIRNGRAYTPTEYEQLRIFEQG